MSGAALPDGAKAVRVVVIAAVGSGLAIIALGVSRVSEGFTEGAMFLLAAFTAAVTIGAALAWTVNAWLDSPRRSGAPLPRPLPRRRRRRWIAGALACSECGRPMLHLDYLWICDVCDRVPSDTSFRQN